MVAFVKSVYRRIIHPKIRELIWHLRSFIKGKNKADRRSAIADLHLYFKSPIAKVQVGRSSFFVDLRDEGVGRTIFTQREYEPKETAFLRSILRPGMNVCDVGANIGYFTIVASECVGPQGKVFAFEPDPHNFKLLQRNVAANKGANVFLHNEGLGSKPCSLKLFKSANNFGDHRLFALNQQESEKRGQIEVNVDTMDAMLERHSNPRLDCVKMDVQGYEHHVIQGMIETFQRNPALILLMEFWPHGITSAGSDPRKLFDDLLNAGYGAYPLAGHIPERKVCWDELLNLLPPMNLDRADQSFVNIVFRR